MTPPPELNAGVAAELARGRAAQAAGLPGRARVCARRAAGLALKAWFQARSGEAWGGDAMKQLKRAQAEPAAPEAVRAAAERLTTKVDYDHALPFADDPLVDAELIIAFARS
ncbi:MAG: hypothetical protein IT317_15035 [Anaerolineales bacterium]|nr:hypothetical protein [Anaerolineales bacterium]